MASYQAHFLTALVVFRNTLNEELIRSLHVYRYVDGKEEEVEREFVFSADGAYVEMETNPLLRIHDFRISELFEGRVLGLWLCIFVFDADRPPLSVHIPSILSLPRNPKLKSIPTLANDFQLIFQFSGRKEYQEPARLPAQEMYGGNKNDDHQFKRSLPVIDQDLNCLPYSSASSESSENQLVEQSDQGIIVKKKKRAASEDIAKLALEDLAKHFDLPIAEASRNLKVGLTVLKKKCREFGITRWPHRKIKSLDALIRDVQEEVERQRMENTAVATAVAKRQMMLEREKESIEKRPFMEIQSETKRFRQDIFKRRHKAKALKNQC